MTDLLAFVSTGFSGMSLAVVAVMLWRITNLEKEQESNNNKLDGAIADINYMRGLLDGQQER